MLRFLYHGSENLLLVWGKLWIEKDLFHNEGGEEDEIRQGDIKLVLQPALYPPSLFSLNSLLN